MLGFFNEENECCCSSVGCRDRLSCSSLPSVEFCGKADRNEVSSTVSIKSFFNVNKEAYRNATKNEVRINAAIIFVALTGTGFTSLETHCFV